MVMTAHVVSHEDEELLHRLKHYLPSQAPLKDFIHHNPLHASQARPFHLACAESEARFGYHTRLLLGEYRQLYRDGVIRRDILQSIASKRLGNWIHAEHMLTQKDYNANRHVRIGALRDQWKSCFRINLDKEVHPVLFRLLASYTDQGIAIWQFPHVHSGFLTAVGTLEQESKVSLFRSEFVRDQFIRGTWSLGELLRQIAGDQALHERYLFDQQFAHPGWSGMACIIERQPDSLLDSRRLSLYDLVMVELYLELDALDSRFGAHRRALGELASQVEELFAPVTVSESDEVLATWQEALEWSYYDQVICGLTAQEHRCVATSGASFQAIFCIDDRECSIRRHIEKHIPDCQTYGTPGFFQGDFYFRPEHSKFHTKVCPAPVTPRHLIEEQEASHRHAQDRLETRHGHGLLGGWLVSQTMGFMAATRLIIQVLFPRENKLMVTSSAHMDPAGRLTIEHEHGAFSSEGLQIGYTPEEMALRAEELLRSIGLVKAFAPLIYVMGHGASSINNTYYAGYDCGACSGRPGSVNARVFAHMANHPEVRQILMTRGIYINDKTRFVAGLHDTTVDSFQFYDLDQLTETQRQLHGTYQASMDLALSDNAKERSRRFLLVRSSSPSRHVHRKVSRRAISLFEPRPELNHATNALCIVGSRTFSRHLYLDRRAFLNSYHYGMDPDGKHLAAILGAVTPVCGGINLEYFFSRMDNARLGSGSKLPHNVVGLVGVANGTDGDLRPGLPSQMIEMHTPLRLLVVVEHAPEVVLQVISRTDRLMEWYGNGWINLVAVDPKNHSAWRYNGEQFEEYTPLTQCLPVIRDVLDLDEFTEQDLPVYILK